MRCCCCWLRANAWLASASRLRPSAGLSFYCTPLSLQVGVSTWMRWGVSETTVSPVATAAGRRHDSSLGRRSVGKASLSTRPSAPDAASPQRKGVISLWQTRQRKAASLALTCASAASSCRCDSASPRACDTAAAAAPQGKGGVLAAAPQGKGDVLAAKAADAQGKDSVLAARQRKHEAKAVS